MGGGGSDAPDGEEERLGEDRPLTTAANVLEG